MNLSKIRRWIEEEKRYLWIVVGLVLFYSAFSLFEALRFPGERERGVPQEDFLVEEERLRRALQENGSFRAVYGAAAFLLMGFFIAGILLTLRFLKKIERKEWAIPWGQPERQISWTLRDVFHVVVLIVLSAFLVELSHFVLVTSTGWSSHDGARMLGATLFTDLIAVCLILHVVKIQKGQPLSLLGLSPGNFSRNLFFGLKSYTTLLPALFATLLVSLWLAEFFRWAPPAQPLYEIFKGETSRKVFGVGILMVVFLGPVIEEIFFRGFLYSALKVQWGRRWAIPLSGVLFAALHANWVGFLPITLLGCVLAYGYEATGSLVAPMTIHILHNSLVMTFFLFTNYFLRFLGVS